MNAWWAQTRAEVRMTVRRGETLLLTIGIPVLLLVFFTETHVIATPSTSRINYLAPGVIALCVMSTSFVALSIATGFERTYGVLRRLHVTPLGRTRLILAKIAGVVAVEILQIAVVAVVAVLLGWRPAGGVSTTAQAIGALLCATAGFAGIGLALAGWLRAELNLAAANGLYLILLLISGFVIPVSSLPSGLRAVVIATPSGALASSLHHTLGHGANLGVASVACLVGWAVASPLLAAKTFRFD